MSVMISEVYDAFLSADADQEKAKKASEAIANFEERFSKANLSMRTLDSKVEVGLTRIDGQLKILKWMVGLSITLNIGILLKIIFG